MPGRNAWYEFPVASGVFQRVGACAVAAAVVFAPRLAQAGREEVPALMRQLVTGTIGEQNRAIDRLKYLGPDVSGPSLRLMLASEDPQDRLAATSALVVVHYRGAQAALESVLTRDEDWEVRRNAVNALAGIRATHATPLIAKALQKDAQAKVRKACVSALSTLGGGTSALAAAAVHDDTLEIRLAALDALSHSMDRSVAPTVRPLLGDSSGLLRFAAARTLAWQGDAAAKKFLTEALNSKDSESIRRGVTALSDVPSEWAADLLAHAADGSDELAACDAAAALARRTDARGTKKLLEIANAGGATADRAQQWLTRLGQGKTP